MADRKPSLLVVNLTREERGGVYGWGYEAFYSEDFTGSIGEAPFVGGWVAGGAREAMASVVAVARAHYRRLELRRQPRSAYLGGVPVYRTAECEGCPAFPYALCTPCARYNYVGVPLSDAGITSPGKVIPEEVKAKDSRAWCGCSNEESAALPCMPGMCPNRGRPGS